MTACGLELGNAAGEEYKMEWEDMAVMRSQISPLTSWVILILPGEEGGVLLKRVCSILFWLSDYFLLYHTMAR